MKTVIAKTCVSYCQGQRGEHLKVIGVKTIGVNFLCEFGTQFLAEADMRCVRITLKLRGFIQSLEQGLVASPQTFHRCNERLTSEGGIL